eukprot:TRINITY_DN93024_c0_g1_i1.p1 TRINITY_DN93024_c0_g1~~TRINITY_DN93024_c0_g1_i1.p1  ORF type:complete len:315 (+),score=71.15 TRINITY_DN93024_c0_g1_i1:61-1005(+)
MASRALRRALVRHQRRSLSETSPAWWPLLHRGFAGEVPGGSLSPTANSFINLGKFESMGSDAGRMATGIAYLQETLEVQQSQFDAETDPRRKSLRGLGLAKTLNEVGRQHHQMQDPTEAIGYYKRALALYDDAIALYEKDDSEKGLKALTHCRFARSEVLSSLGVAYNDASQPDEALAMHRQALELREDIVGRSHPAVGECLNNLGGLYFARGSHQKAAEHFEQAFELLVEAGEGALETPYAALTLYNLGLCRANLGQMPAAATALKRALQIAERSLGSDHVQCELIRATLKQGCMPSSPSAQAGQKATETKAE